MVHTFNVKTTILCTTYEVLALNMYISRLVRLPHGVEGLKQWGGRPEADTRHKTVNPRLKDKHEPIVLACE